MEYGNKLNPECSLRKPKGIKETRQKVIVTHNLSLLEIMTNYYNQVTDWPKSVTDS